MVLLVGIPDVADWAVGVQIEGPLVGKAVVVDIDDHLIGKMLRKQETSEGKEKDQDHGQALHAGHDSSRGRDFRVPAAMIDIARRVEIETPPRGEQSMTNPTTRRGWVKSTAGLAALMSAAGARPLTAAAKPPSPEVYTRIGVKPFINCTATITRNGGSLLLPEVIEAVEHASHYHVQLSALIDAASQRISELLEVPWAHVCSGAAAGLAHATSACIAGANPEWRQSLPNLKGMRNEVIMPKWSRNQYDHSIRMVGARIVEVESVEEARAAFSPHPAMVALLGDRFGNDRPNLRDLAPLAKERGVPVLVDAAPDLPIVPNPYLKDGADLVVYSGGKILRGPQSSGILLGREDLVRVAAMNAAPNSGFGRPMKVAKEELVALTTAVEIWVKERDIEREYAEWEGWYDHISREVRQAAGVETEVLGPTRGGPFPTLRVSWDTDKIGLRSSDVHHKLLASEPAIMTWDYGDRNYFVIRPVALKPDEYKVVARTVRSILAAAPKGHASCLTPHTSPRRRHLGAGGCRDRLSPWQGEAPTVPRSRWQQGRRHAHRHAYDGRPEGNDRREQSPPKKHVADGRLAVAVRLLRGR